MEKRGKQFLVGVGGWDHEIFDHSLYSKSGLESVRKLAHYSESFDVTEVRHTFWDDSVAARDAGEWIGAVSGNRRFQFSVRLHKSFTHRNELTPKATRSVRSVLHELAKCNRLSGLFAQFPYSFTNTSANRFHLTKLSEVFSGFPFFVEMRHASWNFQGFLDFVEEHGTHPVNIDMPRLKQFMPCRSDVVGDVAYMRLHGRNEKGWLVNGVDTRYDYLYNGKEMRELKRRSDRLSEKADSVVIIFNNTTGGKALANAFQLQAILCPEKRNSVPPKTTGRFPYLLPLASVSQGQTELEVGERWKEVI